MASSYAYRSRNTPSSRSRSNRNARRNSSTIPALHVFLVLLTFRIVNALTLRTFFVPDEHYQSLEPAWQLAFGPKSGAWLTWEWRHQLRSSLHPILFAGVYRLCALLCQPSTSESASEAALLLAAPKVVQALLAAGLDFFTWKLAQRVYGSGSRVAWTALAVTVLSPWQWFCSTRTLSNSLEASLTAAALYYWPWDWLLPQHGVELKSADQRRRPELLVTPSYSTESSSRPSLALLLAAIASALRPTNVLVWVPVALQTLSVISNQKRASLIVQAILAGTIVACISVGADYWFYGFVTFPQLRFLTYNIHQDLAVFYGRHRFDYYVTEGLPLLLMGLLPFTIFGLWRSAAIAIRKTSSTSFSLEVAVLPNLTWTILTGVFVMSQIAHKEARFIYPLLPALHVIGGASVSNFTRRAGIWKGFIILVILGLHFWTAKYTSRTHQQGVINVLHYLRGQHEITGIDRTSTAAFLMPCHSTPWRSHLIYSNIDAWALTCEPPVNMAPAERAAYIDEADVFYNDVAEWLNMNMESLKFLESSSIQQQVSKSEKHVNRTINGQITGTNRPWPQYLVFFEQLLPAMVSYLPPGRYQICEMLFNTHWHDDSRRKGNVFVFCMVDQF